ncbi:hypothetical protein PGTUg99_009829 [Puccinia graminis f. sp. tritici]|uniref:Clock-controlled protein 8 n=1 Tax=Puccinia graminis f. sp. tritici TaxID=56615 RepID=A0A5B0S310_PUCGR|nr:hypothetical protein PGTUg99_009829 [Puccinia graminis f. sp. tritici]
MASLTPQETPNMNTSDQQQPTTHNPNDYYHQQKQPENMAHNQEQQQPIDPESSGEFLQRVGKMPLFSGVVRAYERGKGTSKVVRYGADLVESSVTSLSGRVASKVGPERIAQIDRYAGAALDRLGQFSHSQSPATSPPCQHCHSLRLLDTRSSPQEQELHRSIDQPGIIFPAPPDHPHPHQHELGTHDGFDTPTITTSFTPHPHLHPSHQLYSQQSLEEHDGSEPPTPAASPGGRLVYLTPRNSLSRWQNMLVEAGVTAGGIGAAVSEESMKSLQYCLQWLHYATVHLDHQITVLRDLIQTMNEGVSMVGGDRRESAQAGGGELEEEREESNQQMVISAQTAGSLAGIKTEVVETIRKVVAVVSKYAGVGLPEPAKQFVRTSILGLPLRWAEAIQPSPSTAASTSIPPGYSAGPVDRISNPKTATLLAAGRVLTFAVESLDMLKSITAIFSESVERADAWVERLRLIGIQHRHEQAKNKRDGRVVSSGELGLGGREGSMIGIAGGGGGGMGRVSRMEVDSSEGCGAIGGPSSETGRGTTQGGLVRSRCSSTSTMDESARSLSSSMMSGWERSTVGSANTSSSTTLAGGTAGSSSGCALPFSANGVIKTPASADRTTAKRRKANTPPPPQPTFPLGSSLSQILRDDHHLFIHPQQQQQQQHHHHQQQQPRFLNPSCPSPSSSLHKLLLDQDQVSAFDLVHRWAHVDHLAPPPPPPHNPHLGTHDSHDLDSHPLPTDGSNIGPLQ